MIILRDLYTQTETVPLSSSDVTLGQTVIQYEVRSYVDTRNLGRVKSYIVTCTQRLVLPNPSPFGPQAETITSFLNYPALLTNQIAISDPNNILQSTLLMDYTPRTLNTAVATSQNQTTNQDFQVSQQSTTGSAHSQTNSYGASASIGFFGPMPVGDLSGNYQHSSTDETSRSLSTGQSVDKGTQLSNSNSMTIKDWGSYSQLDVGDQTPTWVWGQEFPWNVIQFRGVDSNGNILLPGFIQQRLFDGTVIYPPSELSLLGVDFVASASWLVVPNAGIAGPQEIAFNHSVNYGAASHQVTASKLVAKLTTYAPILYTSQTLDLPVLALDPIMTGDSSSAVLGFVANQFDVAPTAAGGPFAITSVNNTLLVRGAGFNEVMSTDFTTGPVQMTLYFKTINAAKDVTLWLKNWTSVGVAVQLSIVVNGNAALTKFVDAPEAGSGGDNVTSIVLRNQDFTSIDYCDYLQMGLNTVVITITPVNAATPSFYQIMALAVG